VAVHSALQAKGSKEEGYFELEAKATSIVTDRGVLVVAALPGRQAPLRIGLDRKKEIGPMPKRLIVTAPRQVEFEEVPIPDCPGDGLLVRAKVTAVSTGTEVRVYRGIPVDKDGGFLHTFVPTFVPFRYPYINSESMVGEVLEVGIETSGFDVGDRVFVTASHRHYAAVSAQEAIKLPDTIPDEVAAVLNILEVGHIGLRKGSPQPGENVAIIGASVIGLSALAYCRTFGFRTAVVELARKRLDLAGAMGADLLASPED